MAKKPAPKPPVQRVPIPAPLPTADNAPFVARAAAVPPPAPRIRGAFINPIYPTGIIFGQRNYTLMLVGIALVIVGFVLMRGGAMPNPNTWDETLIYSPIRITLAPFVIVVGLAVEVWAIFRR